MCVGLVWPLALLPKNVERWSYVTGIWNPSPCVPSRYLLLTQGSQSLHSIWPLLIRHVVGWPIKITPSSCPSPQDSTLATPSSSNRSGSLPDQVTGSSLVASEQTTRSPPSQSTTAASGLDFLEHPGDYCWFPAVSGLDCQFPIRLFGSPNWSNRRLYQKSMCWLVVLTWPWQIT